MKLFVCGFPGTGKDTVAEMLAAYGFVNIKFATELYRVAHEMFGMPPSVKDRKLLQNIGAFARSIDKDYWIKKLIHDAKEKLDYGNSVIVTDCRFINEYEYLTNNGFTGIYIKSEESDCVNRLKARDGDAQLSTLNAPSEQEHKLFKDKCITLNNTGTIEQLYDNVVLLYNTFKKDKTINIFNK